MKYEVGDRVQIKSLDWYNENKDEDGNVEINENFVFYADRSKYCGKVFTISKVFNGSYSVKEDNGDYYWTDGMIEGLVEEGTKPNVIEEAKTYWDSIKDAWICPEGYQFKDENGNVINATKIVLEKKKKEYPKTYEECSRIIDYHLEGATIIGYKKSLLENFQKLLICRDAYWKIAGEEMGLGKPWEPDYDSGVNKYGIICMNGVVQESNPTTNWERHLNKVLDFPTAEMRDAFSESEEISKLIELCKELL